MSKGVFYELLFFYPILSYLSKRVLLGFFQLFFVMSHGFILRRTEKDNPHILCRITDYTEYVIYKPKQGRRYECYYEFIRNLFHSFSLA